MKHRSLRGTTIIIGIIACLMVIVVAKCLGYDIPRWLGWVVSVVIAVFVALIDKQLPTRRWKSFTLLFLFFIAVFGGFGVWRFVVKGLPLETDAWILGIMLLLSLGYGSYCLWRWHRSVREYREVALQRELRARRRRKSEY